MKSYSTMPLWQKLLIYAIVGGIIYFAIYYFVFAQKGGIYNTNSGYGASSSSQQNSTSSGIGY